MDDPQYTVNVYRLKKHVELAATVGPDGTFVGTVPYQC